jgi:formylglycine-generating enzyme required for sulfatase activity
MEGQYMKNHVFISYSSTDRDPVKLLAADLRSAGVDVWLDEWEITVGDHISEKIDEGLQGSQFLAIWLTKAAVESGWVNREWRSKYAREISDKSKIILPLLAESCDVPPLLEDKQYADFRIDYNRGLADLLRVVIGQKTWENQLGIKFALVPPGTFLMGSNRGEENERPVHQVAIRSPFYMGIYVITQAQWIDLMGTEPWKGNPNVLSEDETPAVHVSWFDAQDFLTRLSSIDKENSYYLPNEAEWEYAARAGTTTEFCFGDDDRDLRAYGWYRDMTQRGEEYAHRVGTKKPNSFGLFDMHGNVWEWTDSWYFGSYAIDPKLSPLEKVVRGGGWDYPAHGARSSFRNHLLPSRSLNVLGFRLLCRRA